MESLPTLYEYYDTGNVTSGLTTNESFFRLNEKKITLYSGAIHYFRVPQTYWRDRLRKLRAAGLNTVETYVPWNLHEIQPGVYDFGKGDSDFQSFLDIVKYVQMAQEEDLFVIVRPGPYICSEWDFGGLPSWLLRENDIKIRTSDENFMKPVKRYFETLLSLLVPLQFTKGGPIIAFQIENEYGNVKKPNMPIDTKYLENLKEIMLANGVVELLFTSDTPSNGNWGSIPGVLNTANFQSDPDMELSTLQKYQPGKPLMVMEYWSGWFDHWTENHHTRSNQEFVGVLERILKFPSSFNIYMFHGGSNWGFLNGANIKDSSTDNGGFQPDTSSYDYDAPLTENGNYTDKYYGVMKLLEELAEIKISRPELPKPPETIAYDSIEINQQLTLVEILNDAVKSKQILSMELLPINNNSGQSYGYVVYRKQNLSIPANSVLKIEGRVCDSVLVLINGRLKSKVLSNSSDLNEFGYWKFKDSFLILDDVEYVDASLELVVENWGRSNYGKLEQFNQKKGLWQGDVLLNDEVLTEWSIYPLEFKKTWVNSLKGWHDVDGTRGPALYKGILRVDEPKDTFVDMRAWKKGIVIVNGFVLSRYLRLGPQQTAYLPGPFLKSGANEIIVFEHFEAAKRIDFSNEAVFETLP